MRKDIANQPRIIVLDCMDKNLGRVLRHKFPMIRNVVIGLEK